MYEKQNVKTIDVKVGEQFEIRGQTATHIDGRMFFPKNAFKLVDTKIIPLPKDARGVPLIDGRPERVYTLEALTAGTYEVEHQGLNPKWRRTSEEVAYAEVYTVNVLGEFKTGALDPKGRR